MAKKCLIAAALLPLLLAVTGCGGGEGMLNRARVVTTTGMIGWMAERIAGDAAQVYSLMGQGVDPHLYKASEGDVRRLGDADLVLYNGLHLEGKMGEILEKMGHGRPVLAVTRDLPRDALRALPGTEDQRDPHVWFDVRLWSQTADLIAAEMSALWPAEADSFTARARALRTELAELDAWVEAEIAKVPDEQRMLITAHDAFGYFGDRYGIEVMGLQGVSTLAEVGLQDVEGLVETILTRRIKAVFVETSVPKRSLVAVQAACRARGHKLEIGGELFSDALGTYGSPEGSYPGMIRHNVNSIVEALK